MYLKERLLPNYYITQRVLKEAQSLLNKKYDNNNNSNMFTFSPEKVIGFGVGCGSASAAAMDLFRSSGEGISHTSVKWIHGE